MACNLRGSSSSSSFERLWWPGSNSSQPSRGSWMVKRRVVMLFLFVLVLGGLLLSSMTLVMHIGSTSMAPGPVKTLRLQARSTQHTRAAAGETGGTPTSSSTTTKVQPEVMAAFESGSRDEPADQAQSASQPPQRHRWRWKRSSKQQQQDAQDTPQAAPQEQQQQQQQGKLGSAVSQGSSSSHQGSLALPSSLVAQLEQQPPAEVVTTAQGAAAAVSTDAAAASKTEAATAAAAAAQLVAAPEDVSLILASGQGNGNVQQQQQQQQQQEDTAMAGLPAGVDAADATSAYIKARGLPPARVKHPLWWHGPMWAGSGYGSEAVNYVLSLLRTGRLAPADVWAYHHGDTWREHVVKSMSAADRSELEYLQSLPVKYRSSRSAVVVCHSVPTNWAFPEPMWVAGAPCPPNPKEFAWVYSVGRTMFETDRLPAVFVPRLNAMNEIWMPSEWQRQSFIQSGVDASKLVVVPEGVNTSLFDPARYTPLPLRDKAQLVFGNHWEVKLEQQEQQQAAAAAAADPRPEKANAAADPLATVRHNNDSSSSSSGTSGAFTGSHTGSINSSAGARSPRSRSGMKPNSSSSSSRPRQPFRFISTFKWEQRKGWDILLEAYLTAFTADDDVELYILTQPFGKSGSSFKEKMSSWADKLNITHTSSSSSSGGGRIGRSLLDDTGLQQGALTEQQQVAYEDDDSVEEISSSSSSGSQHEELQGRSADVNQQQLWAAHVDDVVRQMQGYARQLQHTRRLQEVAVGPEPAGQQRHLLQLDPASSAAKPAGINTSTTEAVPAGGTGTIPPAATTASPAVGAATSSPAAAAAAFKQASAGASDAAAAASARYPALYVVNSHISDADFPRFYKTGDAFVLPSRGEGWGRPHVEAMSMGLPVISTNWSGITAYLDESVGYPIGVDGLVPVSGGDEVIWWFRGLKWAQPSVKHLTQLMQRVYSNRAEAAAKGAAARARMVDRYSPDAIADILVKELQRIQDKVP